jgi:hypothetical protein
MGATLYWVSWNFPGFGLVWFGDGSLSGLSHALACMLGLNPKSRTSPIRASSCSVGDPSCSNRSQPNAEGEPTFRQTGLHVLV